MEKDKIHTITMALCALCALLLSCSVEQLPTQSAGHPWTPSEMIPPGMRSLTIAVDGGIRIVPGDRADLMFTNDEGESSTVLSNVEVKFVNQTTSAVTLWLSREDGEKLPARPGKFSLGGLAHP